MKNSILLIVVLFLIFPKISFGDENSQINNFNDYINSSKVSSEPPVNKNTNLSHPTDNNSKKNSNKTDSKAAPQDVPTKWEACTINSDCTAAAVDCVTWEPLNKKYLNKFSKNLNACSESIDPGFQPETVCVDKVCETTEKSTNVSWEEWLDEMRKGRKQSSGIK